MFAALPTLKKSFAEPETEDLLTYILYTIGGLFTVLAVQEWTFAIAITPIYILSLNALIVLLLTRHKTQSLFYTDI